MSQAPVGSLGLIAGQGELPLAAARSVAGRRIVAIGFEGLTDPGLAALAEVVWLDPGQVGQALGALRAAGVREAVMLGKVPKAGLLGDGSGVEPDVRARRLLAGLRDRSDDAILAAVADLLAEHGIALLEQAAVLPSLVAAEGVLGSLLPTVEQRVDVAYGFNVAKAIAALDVGQTVVVKQGAVLAVEAIEGTDATIRRAGAITSGACIVKVAKPGQDPRFDVPTIGPDTLFAAREAGAGLLAFEAGHTLVIARERLVAEADAHGIVVLGTAGGAVA
ncbi:MAG: UDP-2,3-diacylglucosamine diphosphatase LpxI [Deltaproteobacteria bacterium]|nr:UDP-2,3-diacylglucosamine diphosphatase LpxI [Deltaproteobacteria bacterium]MBW2361496.1 UDP-2,3-diacylglucosamine diphosphatase LpxI [Deltaproteobacteria bacterium]